MLRVGHSNMSVLPNWGRSIPCTDFMGTVYVVGRVLPVCVVSWAQRGLHMRFAFQKLVVENSMICASDLPAVGACSVRTDFGVHDWHTNPKQLRRMHLCTPGHQTSSVLLPTAKRKDMLGPGVCATQSRQTPKWTGWHLNVTGIGFAPPPGQGTLDGGLQALL